MKIEMKKIHDRDNKKSNILLRQSKRYIPPHLKSHKYIDLFKQES